MIKTILSVLFVLCSWPLLSTELDASPTEHVPGQFVVWLHPKAAPSVISEHAFLDRGMGLKSVERLNPRYNIWLFQLDNPALEPEALMWLQDQPEVQIVQLNHTNIQHRALPNDSLFFKQWHLQNDGTNGGNGQSDMDAAGAWNVCTGGLTAHGDEIVVAVIDQGFDTNHADLQANYFFNKGEIPGNGIDDDDNGFVDDHRGWNFYTNSNVHAYNNHGTHVAGIVGATGNNDMGISGVNWRVKVLPITGASTLESTVIQAYAYVLEMRKAYNESHGQRGAYIVATNSSFGVDKGQPEDYPIWCAFYDSLGHEGIISAAATANANVDVDSVGDIPTTCPSDFLIAVTNSNSEDELNGFAATGAEHIDLAAPGTRIYSTTLNGTYGNSSGTSMSSPQVAGAIALMQAAICSDDFDQSFHNPAERARELKQQMITTGVDSIAGFQTLMQSGGRLNLAKCVAAVNNGCFEVAVNASVSNCGQCNGQLTAMIRGGVPPFQYHWSNGDTSATLSDACPGLYTLTVTDAQGDSALFTTVVSNAEGMSLEWDLQHPLCAGDENGAITIDTEASVIWSDGATGSTRTLLSGGTYSASIDDSSGCSQHLHFNLISPQPMIVSGAPVLPTSAQANDGSLTAEVRGGVGPYEFEWEDGSSGRTIVNRSEGWYMVTVTDAQGCELVDSLLLGYPVGVNEFKPAEDGVRLYPNPAHNDLNIKAEVGIKYLQIFNAQGQLIHDESVKIEEGETVRLGIRHMASGHYWVRVYTNTGMIAIKPLVITR